MAREPDPEYALDGLPLFVSQVPPDETRPGRGVVYDWFVGALKGSPYEQFALDIRARWRQRVAERRWPQFTAR